MASKSRFFLDAAVPGISFHYGQAASPASLLPGTVRVPGQPVCWAGACCWRPWFYL